MPEPLDHVERICATRVDLVSLSGGDIASLLDGRREDAAGRLRVAIPVDWPDADDLSLLKLRLQDIRRDPTAQQWLLRAIVRRHPVPLMVGHVGFHGPPGVNGSDVPGAVELGYTVFPAYRRRGYAREAVTALIDWARSVHGIRRFLASIAPENEPSARIVTAIGFVHTGQRCDDEDGLELVFELDAPPVDKAGGA